MVPFVYAPLVQSQSIRLLTLLHGNSNDPIFCRLDHQPRPNRTAYDALSYTWGDEKATSVINILPHETFGGYREFKIIPNLENALRQLRDPYQEKVYWIDAVCINQEDMNEKSLQVPKMAQIYSEASNVRVWLGLEAADSKLALNFISRILNFEDFDRLMADSRLAKDWAALLLLMKRPWFFRRWVVQEIALAKRATLHCGKDWVKWSDFADAVGLFEERSETIQGHFRESSAFGHHANFFGDIRALGATRLVHATSNLFRKADDGHILEHLSDLESLVSDLSAFKASNPRDIIYGVLALAKDTRSTAKSAIATATQNGSANATTNHTVSAAPPDHAATSPPINRSTPGPKTKRKASTRGSSSQSKHARRSQTGGHQARRSIPEVATEDTIFDTPTADPSKFTERQKYLVRKLMENLRSRLLEKSYDVNYNSSFFLVCKDFLNFVIKKSNRLDILCRPWAPTSVEDERLPTWIPTLAGDAFGMRSDGNFVRINADPLVGRPGEARRNYNAAMNYPAKWRFGSAFPRPEEYKSLFVRGFVLDTIGKTSRHPAMSGDIPAGWAEFGGWMDSSANPPDRYWRTLIADRGPDGLNPPAHYQRACKHCFTKTVVGGPLDVRDLLGDPSFNSVAKQFLKRMQSVVWMRSLMLTTKNDYLGLVPDQSKEGDLICIIFGCSVPIVLRKIEGRGGKSCFHFIGGCYVHEMMDGKAMKEVEAENYCEFELR